MINIYKFDNDIINYVKQHYLNKTAEEIAKEINLKPFEIREIAKKIGITKRIYLNELFQNEFFINIPNYSNYKISNYGRFIRKKDNLVIQWEYTDDGYPTIKLVNDEGKRRINRVHRLVALIFIPNNDLTKIEVNHKDGNKENSHISNLEWTTPSDNQTHAYKNGLRDRKQGEKSCRAKYTEKDIIQICELFVKGYDIDKIYNYFNGNINKNSIKNIKNKTRWKHICDKYNY